MEDFLEFNENDDMAYPNLWDTIKAVYALVKKLERSYTSNLLAYLRALEQKEANYTQEH